MKLSRKRDYFNLAAAACLAWYSANLETKESITAEALVFGAVVVNRKIDCTGQCRYDHNFLQTIGVFLQNQSYYQ
jgi:hypothetical protein